MYRLILVFFTGSSLVSFLTCLIYRYRHDIHDRYSVCDHCGRILPWYVKIPVLGYFLSFGRCVRCGYRIPLCYPLAESAGGLLFVLLYLLQT